LKALRSSSLRCRVGLRVETMPTSCELAPTWTKVSGPGSVVFADTAQTRTSASFSQPGVYVLRLSASDTLLTASDDVSVTVSAAACTTTSSGMVAWWAADGRATDLQGGAAAVMQNGTFFVPGKVLEAFSLDGTDDQVNAGHAASLNVSGGDFTVDAWVPVWVNTASRLTRGSTRSAITAVGATVVPPKWTNKRKTSTSRRTSSRRRRG